MGVIFPRPVHGGPLGRWLSCSSYSSGALGPPYAQAIAASLSLAFAPPSGCERHFPAGGSAKLKAPSRHHRLGYSKKVIDP
jgi:hypothetical protein